MEMYRPAAEQMVVDPHYASIFIQIWFLFLMIHQASSSFKIVFYNSFYTSCTGHAKPYPESVPFCFISLSLLFAFTHFSLPTMANNLRIKVQHRGTNCPYSSMILSVQRAGSHPHDRGYYSQIGLSIKPTRPMNGSFNLFRQTGGDKRVEKNPHKQYKYK